MATFITGIFYDAVEAEEAVEELEDLGYSRDQISVVAQDGTEMPRDTKEHHVAADAGIGATYGGALGAILAGIAATGTIVATGGAAAPLVAGPLAAVLAGLGAGAVGGGVIGGLVGLGVPEDSAKTFQRELNNGGLLIGVTARTGDETNVRDVLENPGGSSLTGSDADDDDELLTPQHTSGTLN